MNARGFWPEVGIALLLSIAGAAGYLVLQPLFGVAGASRLLLLGVASGYLLALLWRHAGGPGRVLAVAAWMAASLALLLFDPPLVVWLLTGVGGIWLLRGLLRRRRPLALLFDATLCAGATLAALATLQHSRSLLLALWVFFLLQALNVFIDRRGSGDADRASPAQQFDAARRTAEAALRRLDQRSA
jgi:hypothetical protein